MKVIMRNFYPLVLIHCLPCIMLGQFINECYNDRSIKNDFSVLKPNLYISKTELSVGEYVKYLDVIAKDSSFHFVSSQQPDSLSEDYIEYANTTSCGCGPMYISRYAHPAYFDYPAFGLTYIQVVNYCNWLTTNSEIYTLNSDKYKLHFRLPTKEEWILANNSDEVILSNNLKKRLLPVENCAYSGKIFDSLGINPKKIDKTICTNFNVGDIGKFIFKDSIYTYVKSALNCYSRKPQPSVVYDEVCNPLELYHLNDNLSEMLLQENLAMGWNYNSITAKTGKMMIINYSGPHPWLGARLICELILIE